MTKAILILKNESSFGERYQIQFEEQEGCECFVIGRQKSYGGFDIAHWGIPDYKMYTKSRCRSLIAKIKRIKANNFDELKAGIKTAIKALAA